MHTSPVQIMSSPVIAIYQKIATITGKMRAAAQGKHWDDLVKLGHQYNETVETLRYVPAVQPVSAKEREDRVQLLSEILNNDAAVRDLAMPELARVNELLNVMKKQKSMLHAYGPTAGSAFQ